MKNGHILLRGDQGRLVKESPVCQNVARDIDDKCLRQRINNGAVHARFAASRRAIPANTKKITVKRRKRSPIGKPKKHSAFDTAGPKPAANCRFSALFSRRFDAAIKKVAGFAVNYPVET
jgi:hypothetical protein